MDKLLKQQ